MEMARSAAAVKTCTQMDGRSSAPGDSRGDVHSLWMLSAVKKAPQAATRNARRRLRRARSSRGRLHESTACEKETVDGDAPSRRARMAVATEEKAVPSSSMALLIVGHGVVAGPRDSIAAAAAVMTPSQLVPAAAVAATANAAPEQSNLDSASGSDVAARAESRAPMTRPWAMSLGATAAPVPGRSLLPELSNADTPPAQPRWTERVAALDAIAATALARTKRSAESDALPTTAWPSSLLGSVPLQPSTWAAVRRRSWPERLAPSATAVLTAATATLAARAPAARMR